MEVDWAGQLLVILDSDSSTLKKAIYLSGRYALASIVMSKLPQI